MEAEWMGDKAEVNREGKASVFTDLFQIPRYAAKLVQDIHPGFEAMETDIAIVTLHSVLLHEPYNDLGLLVKNRLLLVAEAQSTWSVNVLVRMLIYLAMTYHNYIKKDQLHIYGSKKIVLPQPEFYIIYTGRRKNCPASLSLSKEFFGGSNSIDLRAKVLSNAKKCGISGQYIRFCHVFDEQIRKHGKTRLAMEETLRICREKDVPKEYLEERAKEVKSIMMTLFSQEEAMNAYGRKCREEGREETQLSNIRTLMRNMRLNALEAMNALAIPQEEQQRLYPMV